MTLGRAVWTAALALLPLAAGASAVQMPPEATLAAEETAALSSTHIPVGPFDGQTVPTIRAEGEITRRVWQQPLKGRTTLQLLAPLRAQLIAQDFQVIYECAQEVCGGFDFRFATDTLPEPQMHVDLGDFRFLSARRLASGAPDYVTLMVSRSAARAFVQVTQAQSRPAIAPAPDAAQSGAAERPPLVAQLEQDGHAVLDDLAFATGAATLQMGPFASLDALAAYLLAHPDRQVILVGHTDAVGTLEANIALSRQRALAVRRDLVQTRGVPTGQVTAEGAGYLAPRASNLTDAGRQLNRRVEVVLIATN